MISLDSEDLRVLFVVASAEMQIARNCIKRDAQPSGDDHLSTLASTTTESLQGQISPKIARKIRCQDAKMVFRLLFRLQRAPTLWKRGLTTSTSEPLRILFCGSDEFSCASLKALHAEHETNRSLVESLEVMVLPGKRTGRGFKQVREGMCFRWLVRISLMLDSAL